MSSSIESPPELQRLATRVRGLETALNAARNARRLLTFATLVLVAVSSFAFYKLGDSFRKQENMERLLKEAEARLNDRSDEYMKEVQTLVKNASPKLTAAFYAQAKHDMPLYLEAIGKQRELLLADLQADLEKRLNDVQQEASSRHMAVLDEEFPQIKNSAARERVLRNLQQAMNSLAKKYYVEQMREQVTELCGKLDSFPPAPASREDDAPLEDQLMANMLDLLTLKLADTDADRTLPKRSKQNVVAPGAKPAAAPPATETSAAAEAPADATPPSEQGDLPPTETSTSSGS